MINYIDPVFILGSIAPVEPLDVEKLDFLMCTFGTIGSLVILISVFMHRNNTTQSETRPTHALWFSHHLCTVEAAAH